RHGAWTPRRRVYYDEFLASEAARIEYWDYKLETWEIYQQSQPNAVHHAVVALERAGKALAVVTQNVDGLHRRAGTAPDRLAGLHRTPPFAGRPTPPAPTAPAPALAPPPP